jgi:hypothetical protein
VKIYVFTNIIGNYCDGDYYFIADSESEANKMATDFSFKHNIEVNSNPNYTIEWDIAPKVYEIKKGYIPLNRISLDMAK